MLIMIKTMVIIRYILLIYYYDIGNHRIKEIEKYDKNM